MSLLKGVQSAHRDKGARLRKTLCCGGSTNALKNLRSSKRFMTDDIKIQDPPFRGCSCVWTVLSPEAVARGWPALFEEQRQTIERELGAPFIVCSNAPADEPLWEIGASKTASGPTLRVNRIEKHLVCSGRSLDEVEETFSHLRSLCRRVDGEWIIEDCADISAAVVRVSEEIATSYPAFELRGINWQEVCDHYGHRVLTAVDPIAVMQEWTAQLQDAHTWVRPNPPLGELRYGLWTDGATAKFIDVPEDSEGFLAGVRPGFSFISEDLHDWWRRTAAPRRMKELLVGRRILAAPVGTQRTVKALSPGGKVFEWSETVGPVVWDPLVSWRRLPSGNGYMRIRAFIDDAFDDRVDEAFEELRHCPVLIVDLRGNPGGKLTLAQAFRNRFLREEGTMGWLQPTLPEGGLAAKSAILGVPAPALQRWGREVRFLIDPMTYSASEDALLGLQGLEHVHVVGQPSGGGSGRVRLVRLLPGWRLTISTALTFDRNQRCIEGQGIPVDVVAQNGADWLLSQ